MISHFVVAEIATGLIRQACFASRPWPEVQAEWTPPEGCQLLQLPEALTPPLHHWRVAGGTVVPRAVMPVLVSTPGIAADGDNECALTGLPDPCTVTITGAVSAGPMDITGGSLILTSTAPGAIIIAITADPIWKPWESTIHAT